MANAGEIIDAADINALNTYYVVKAADEAVTSNAVLQNDDDLAADLSVGIWLLEAHTLTSGAQAADVQTAWTTTGTITCLSRSILAPSATATDVSGAAALPRMQSISLTLTQNIRIGTDGSNTGYGIERLILDVDVAGTIQLQWAQFVSTGSATNMRTGSHLVWRALTAG
jgi:hypothetical protein